MEWLQPNVYSVIMQAILAIPVALILLSFILVALMESWERRQG